MKAILFIAIFATIQAASFDRQVIAVSDDFPILGPVDQTGPHAECLHILETVLLQAGEIALAAAQGRYYAIPPLAIKLGFNIQKTIKCYSKKIDLSDLSNLSSLLVADPYNECVMTHLKNAIDAIRQALQNLSMKLYKEAIAQVKIALVELGEAQICPK